MLSVMSAPILQPLIGLALYLFSKGAARHEITAYSVAHFQLALTIVPICVLVAAWIACRLPERQT